MAPPACETLEPLLDAFLTAPDPVRQGRALVAAAFRLAGATGAAVWVRAPEGWTCIASAGCADALPGPAQVEASLAGCCNAELPGGRAVRRGLSIRTVRRPTRIAS